MTIRVISGSAKGRKLKLVPGDTTRPIMDRVKENLFNLVSEEYIAGQRWLDLFGGTGAVGIEALSRGVEHVTFVDAARAAIRTIQENLTATRLTEKALVRHDDAFRYLERTPKQYDVIYVAPPQYHRLWVGALAGIEERINELLVDDGIVVVQIDPKEWMEVELRYLQIYKDRTYGNTQLIFFERKREEPNSNSD